jgi:hypothetical protein
MWYYRQDTIRKSVWYDRPRVLKSKLGEVMAWVSGMAHARQGWPLPVEAVDELQRVYESTCKLVDDGHVIGECPAG